MIADFQFKLASLAEPSRLAELGQDTLKIMAELSEPRNVKDAEAQRLSRQAKIEVFCAKWSVDRFWVNDLVDMYEELDRSGQIHEVVDWLSTQGDIPEPRAEVESAVEQV